MGKCQTRHLLLTDRVNTMTNPADPAPFEVEATVCDGIWTAHCPALGLVTEAETFEALVERAWEIAPELAELNDVGVSAADLRLRFTHETPVARAA